MLDPSLRLSSKQALRDDWIEKYGADNAKEIIGKQSNMNPSKLKHYNDTYRKSAMKLLTKTKENELDDDDTDDDEEQ
jgi:hypothetical protein